MSPIELPLPPGVEAEVLFNSLYDSSDPSCLPQDILLIALPQDIFIDVGWYPERDLTGNYRINVFRQNWDDQLLPEPFRTKDAKTVAMVVRRLVSMYGGPSASEVSWSDEVPARSTRIVSSSSGTRGRIPEYA